MSSFVCRPLATHTLERLAMRERLLSLHSVRYESFSSNIVTIDATPVASSRIQRSTVTIAPEKSRTALFCQAYRLARSLVSGGGQDATSRSGRYKHVQVKR